MEDAHLPRKIRDDPDAAHLARELAARSRPLRAGGETTAPWVETTPGLEAALRSALSSGRIARGLEGAERILADEQRGLEHVDRTRGAERGERISRLLVLADDGSERFYRDVESLLRRHAPRVLALRLDLGAEALGRLLFGEGRIARLVLVRHKDAVSDLLLALAREWGGAAGGR